MFGAQTLLLWGLAGGFRGEIQVWVGFPALSIQRTSMYQRDLSAATRQIQLSSQTLAGGTYLENHLLRADHLLFLGQRACHALSRSVSRARPPRPPNNFL